MKPLVAILTIWSILTQFNCYARQCLQHYTGTNNVTISGKLCLPWTVAKHKYLLKKLNINNYKENFCRNPNNSDSTWCYVTQEHIEKCHSPRCSDNPKTNYCIVVPEAHFQFCPILFDTRSFFQDYGLNKIVFCCASIHDVVVELLPKNTCFIVVIRANDVKEFESPCPYGYYSRSISDAELESNVIYKCCKSTDPFRITPNARQNLTYFHYIPILASVLLNGTLCPNLQGTKLSTVEYHQMDKLSNNILPAIMTICNYYTENMPSYELTHSKLGFLSLKECPQEFLASDDNLRNTTYDSIKMKNCWPRNESYLYSIGRACLNSKILGDGPRSCPNNFQSFQILSALSNVPLFKFCCMDSLDGSTFSNLTMVMKKSDSVAYYTRSGRCPNITGTISMKSFLINVRIKTAEYSTTIFFCSFELQTDEFAYKKIGQRCPAEMFTSSTVVRLLPEQKVQSDNDVFVMTFCVGSATSTGQKFPGGKYCLYKIGMHCPEGFEPKSHLQHRIVIRSFNLVPNYDKEAVCCQNDGNNTVPGEISIPFVDANKTTAFGLLLLNNYDSCQNISGFVSHLDFDIDGPYCAYRSQEEDFLWRNEIVWPQDVPVVNPDITILNVSSSTSWKALSAVKYRPSIIHTYPRGQFCIISQNTCTAISDFNFIMKYPIKGLSICCFLNADPKNNSPASSENLYLKGKHLIGYLAMHGKCPSVDHNKFVLRNVTHDIFETKEEDFDKDYGYNIVRIGVIPDFQSKPSFVKVDFQFCIFEFSETVKYNDKPSLENLTEFIKPAYMICPVGFHEVQKSITINLDENLDPLVHHFIVNNFISICVPNMRMERNKKFGLPVDLCEISLDDCSRDLNLNISSVKSGPPLRICCSNLTARHNTSFIDLPTFSLPLHQQKTKCPQIKNHSSLMWKVPLSRGHRYMSIVFCYYYVPMNPVNWPPGQYFTVAYNKQCPTSFRLMEHNGTDLCLRRDVKPSMDTFPDGSYCILVFFNTKCPSKMSHSTNDLVAIGDRIMNLCCSTMASIVLNIPNSTTNAFSFLSVEKCSFVAGTRVRIASFLSFTKIIQCIYTSLDCNSDTNEKCSSLTVLMDSSVTNEAFLVKRQNIIIVLLVCILFVIIVTGIIMVIYNRDKLAKSGLTEGSNMKLSAIYTVIDNTVNDNIDEDIPSVAYSTI